MRILTLPFAATLIAFTGLAACDAAPDVTPDAIAQADVAADISDAAPEVDVAAFDASLMNTTITVGDLVFDALVAGPKDGIPVILLHGFPQTNHCFRPHVDALGKLGYRAVAPNQRGYSAGARPTEIDAYGLTLLGADITGIADALGFDTFHVVGHDWGSAVAWYLGSSAPARLRSLTAISVPHLDAFAAELADPDSEQSARSAYFEVFALIDSEDFFLASDAAQLKGVYEGVSAESIAEYVKVLGTKAALGAALNWYRANSFATPFDLGIVSVPTLFIWGDKDSAVGPAAANATKDFVSGPYTFETITGGTHWLPDLEVDAVMAALTAHLTAHPGTP